MAQVGFPQTEVSVTLKGEEWTALLGRITGRPFSAKGQKIYKEAVDSLSKQLLAASKANPGGDLSEFA